MFSGSNQHFVTAEHIISEHNYSAVNKNRDTSGKGSYFSSFIIPTYATKTYANTSCTYLQFILTLLR